MSHSTLPLHWISHYTTPLVATKVLMYMWHGYNISFNLWYQQKPYETMNHFQTHWPLNINKTWMGHLVTMCWEGWVPLLGGIEVVPWFDERSENFAWLVLRAMAFIKLYEIGVGDMTLQMGIQHYFPPISWTSYHI